MHATEMQKQIYETLKDAKGQDIRVLDVGKITDFTDFMIIVTGTSSRHVVSMAERVADRMRELGRRPLGTEGQDTGDWVLVDFGDVVVHVMRQQTRDFYNLEKLWSDAGDAGMAEV
jgi:ribosome-associated protein